MKFIYNESMTKNLVEGYYKKYEDIDGSLEIQCGCRKLPPIGRSLIGEERPYISFRLKGSMIVDDETQVVEIALSEAEVENAFITAIEASGRKVKNVSIDFDDKSFKCITVEAVAKRKVK